MQAWQSGNRRAPSGSGKEDAPARPCWQAHPCVVSGVSLLPLSFAKTRGGFDEGLSRMGCNQLVCRNGADGRVVVGVPVIRMGPLGISAGIDGLLELPVRHPCGAVDHSNARKLMEHAGDIGLLRRLLRVVCIEVGDAHEAGRRVVVARDAAHAGTRSIRCERSCPPGLGCWHVACDVEVVPEVLAVPSESRLVCKDVDVVCEDLHAILRVFDRDAALAVADNPVEKRGRIFVDDGGVDDSDIPERCLGFIDGREVRDDPERKLPGGDIRLAGDSFLLILRIAREVEAGAGKAFCIRAVEVERRILLDDAHADDGMGKGGRTLEGREGHIAFGRYDDTLPIALAPVEVAGEVEIAFVIRETDCSAHGTLRCLMEAHSALRLQRDIPMPGKLVIHSRQILEIGTENGTSLDQEILIIARSLADLPSSLLYGQFASVCGNSLTCSFESMSR